MNTNISKNDDGSNDIDTLKEENTRLQDATIRKSEFISISGHQLRTSLSAFKWVLRMFLDGDLGVISEEARGLLEKSYQSNESMISLLSDILTLNHAEDGSRDYNFEEIKLVDFIENIIFSFTAESFKHRIELTFIKPDFEIPLIRVDQAMFRAVLQNLIENAIKYNNDGQSVVISIEHSANSLQIIVKDTGIGIPLDEQSHVFERFYRAKNAIQKEERGSGLGLYTAQKIMEAHRGSISFESQQGIGTTFIAKLPLSPQSLQ